MSVLSPAQVSADHVWANHVAGLNEWVSVASLPGRKVTSSARKIGK